MKKLTFSLLALSLLTIAPTFAATLTPVPEAIAKHDGPIRIAVIRNLGSDDNTTQFIAGAHPAREEAGIHRQYLPEQR